MWFRVATHVGNDTVETRSPAKPMAKSSTFPSGKQTALESRSKLLKLYSARESPGNLAKMQILINRSGVKPEFLHFNKLPGEAKTAVPHIVV